MKQTRHIKGSPSRDEFKFWHKSLNPLLYSTDLDLVLVSKNPPRIVAAIDYKKAENHITFSETLAYNHLTQLGIPVFVVSGERPFSRLTVKKFISGDWRPEPPIIQYNIILENVTRQEYEKWELQLRRTEQ